jgi:hypothetical protein
MEPVKIRGFPTKASSAGEVEQLTYVRPSSLQPQMILPGAESSQKASADEIAAATLRTLQRTIPPAVPSVMFLSGGQSEQVKPLVFESLLRTRPLWQVMRMLEDSLSRKKTIGYALLGWFEHSELAKLVDLSRQSL